MNLERYLAARALPSWEPRPRCSRCQRPQVTCYCAKVLPFASRPRFAILIHHEEAKRGVATGRMAHLCLSNSWLLRGTDFSHHAEVEKILHDPTLYPVLLYPGPHAANLSELGHERGTELFPRDREPVIFVLDGTWAQARKMRRLSRNLHALPQIGFTPRSASEFLVRRQPMPHCYSTIEAIHYVIDWFGQTPAGGRLRPHDNLLNVFRYMVSQQLDFEAEHVRIRGPHPDRGQRKRF